MWIDRIFKFRQKSETDETKPFLEHLEDLRWMVARMGGTVASAMALSLCFRHTLVNIVQHPLKQVDPNAVAHLRTLAPTDSFTISIQIAFYAGLVLSFPLLLYFLAQFVLPALTHKEKKYVLPSIGIGFGFFWKDTKDLGWEAAWTVPQYFSFVTQITLVFGLAFELPVAVLALVYLRLLSFAFLNRTRSYAYILILILAMIIAPSPDVLTFFSLGAPMLVLYEACIWLAWLMERRRK